MKRFTVAQEQELAEQLKQGTTDRRFYKRVQAIYWRTQGRKWKEIAEYSGLRESTLWELCASYRKEGLNGLRSHYVCNNRKLSYADEAAALEKLAEKANVGKYVRASDLSERFKEITGVSYQIDAFYRLLWRHGWRKVKPRGQHPKKASDEAIEASKKLT